MVLTLRLCVLYGSQNKQLLLPCKVLTDWFCITEVKSVYCAARTESSYKSDTFRLESVNLHGLYGDNFTLLMLIIIIILIII